MKAKTLKLEKYFYSSIITLTLILTSCTDTQEKKTVSNDNQKIFIIGDSTAHSQTTINLLKYKKMNCGEDNPDNELQGWGDALSNYMKQPKNLVNQARQGANSLSFKTEKSPERFGVGRDWEGTISKMQKNRQGGFLLIQFGSRNENMHTPKFDKDKNIIDYNHDGVGNKKDNKARISLRKSNFKKHIRYYIDEARKLNLTPVLITTPEARLKQIDENKKLHPTKHRNTRGKFPQYMRELAKEEKLELLDLHTRTLQEFSKYSDKELRQKFGDCTLKNGYIDRTHYEPHGANRVAKLVKELACEMSDPSLCQQFK